MFSFLGPFLDWLCILFTKKYIRFLLENKIKNNIFLSDSEKNLTKNKIFI